MSETETLDKTKKLVEKAFRRKTGINERLLAMRLIQGTFSTDTKSIISNVAMAASMVEQVSPELEGLDFEKIRAIKQIFGDISQTEFARLELPKRGPYDYDVRYARICPIPFSIEQTEETYRKYVSPWIPTLKYRPEGIKIHRKKMTPLRHANELYGYGGISKGCNKVLGFVDPEEADKKELEWIGKKCPHCKKTIEEGVIIQGLDEYIAKKHSWGFFFEVSQCLTHTGFKTLRTAFNNWAEDESGKALMIMGSLVSQNIYDDVLKQLKGSLEEPEENQRRK